MLILGFFVELSTLGEVDVLSFTKVPWVHGAGASGELLVVAHYFLKTTSPLRRPETSFVFSAFHRIRFRIFNQRITRMSTDKCKMPVSHSLLLLSVSISTIRG